MILLSCMSLSSFIIWQAARSAFFFCFLSLFLRITPFHVSSGQHMSAETLDLENMKHLHLMLLPLVLLYFWSSFFCRYSPVLLLLSSSLSFSLNFRNTSTLSPLGSISYCFSLLLLASITPLLLLSSFLSLLSVSVHVSLAPSSPSISDGDVFL